MAARRKVSKRQTELLIKFVEDNPTIAVGNLSRRAQNRKISRQIWKKITVTLNSVVSVSDGVLKTEKQWRRYWIQFKAKTKAKAADSRRQSAAPGVLGKLLPLSPLEKRVLACISPPEVQNIPVIQPPIESPEPNELDLVMNEDWEMFPSPRSHEIYWPPSPEPEPEPEPHITPTHSIDEETGAAGNIPLWMYDIEVRRLAAEERNAAALEALVTVTRDIRDDIRNFLSHHPGFA